VGRRRVVAGTVLRAAMSSPASSTPTCADCPGDFPQRQLTTYADVTVRRDVTGVRDWWLAKSAAEQAALLRELDTALSR